MTPTQRDALKTQITNALVSVTPGTVLAFDLGCWRDDVNAAGQDANHASDYITGVSSISVLAESTVAALPTAVGKLNQEYIVTDATVATNGGTVVGGGAVRVLVRSDNTNWLIV